MIKNAVLEMLRKRNARAGETVEFGWFWFRVCQGDAGNLDLETLDFQEMASFTRDFEIVERLHAQQTSTLESAGVAAEPCTLRHFAIVDPDYEPGHPDVFLYRVSATDRNSASSGWAVGLRSKGFVLRNLKKCGPVSLYELSIKDRRLIPYWLLPAGWSVVFENSQPVLISADQETTPYFSIDDTVPRPWWKFW